MTKYSRFLFLVLYSLLSCERNDTCPISPAGVYEYPTVPKGHTMSVQEVNRFLDIPEDVTDCISTQGLIESCLNYPFLSLIMAGSSTQTGYNLVSSQLRGLPELTNRPDRAEYLLKKYQSIDPMGFNPQSELIDIGRYVFRIFYFEVIVGQSKNLSAFNLDQKIELVTTVQRVYQSKKKDRNVYSEFHLCSTTTLLARLMKGDAYKPFLDLYGNRLNSELEHWYWPADISTADLVYSLSSDYLTFLSQKR